MNRKAPEILICTEDRRACFRLRGRADVSISVGFKEILLELFQQAFNHFELELSECQIMDSTFLGVLCNFAKKCESADPPSRPILFNPNERITELLTCLGVDQMFDFQHGTSPDTSGCVEAVPNSPAPTREQLTTTSLEAHQTLMSLNPDNIPKFKDLMDFLAEDLKKDKGNS